MIHLRLTLPQQPQRAPETAGWAFECWHRFPTASIRNQDDCDTSRWRSPAGQPAGWVHSVVLKTEHRQEATEMWTRVYQIHINLSVF